MSDQERHESAAERAGIVDQQDAALEAIDEATGEGPDPDGADPDAEPGGDVDPMEGPAPTG